MTVFGHAALFNCDRFAGSADWCGDFFRVERIRARQSQTHYEPVSNVIGICVARPLRAR